MRVTIKDIAKHAGVSKTTVSFAFNDPSRISKETAQRVKDVAAELGYFPDPVARTLTNKRVGSFGLLLPQSISEAFKNPYLLELVRGIGDACEERDYSLNILPPVEGRILDAARKAAVDGLLTIGVDPETHIVELMRRRHLPFVTIDGMPAHATANIGIDNAQAAYELMKHVLALGHRRITIVELKSDTFHQPEERSSWVRDLRVAGFDRALHEYGMALAHSDIKVCSTECSIEGGERIAESMSDAELPTAIVAMADIVAIGICWSFRQRGIVVPDQVSVCGFDDIPFSWLNFPPLTTVRQPGYEKGYQATVLLSDLLQNARTADINMPFTLLPRASTGPVRG
jgi:DNA-binding LacI/PurR family transcriptional regulator